MSGAGPVPDAAALAARLAACWSAPLPESVLRMARLAVADCVGAIIAGAGEPEQVALRQRLPATRGACSVVPSGPRSDARRAGFLNACAATAGELDDRLPEARTHPAAHVIPLAAALAEEGGLTGARFLHAVVLGYEAAALLGGCFPERPASLHPHGYWTTAAAAVAAARLRDLPPAALGDLIGTAVLMGPRLPFAAAWQGATIRNAYAGFGVTTALQCLDCVEAGLTAPSDAIAFVRAQVGLDGPPRAVPTDSWAIERVEFKFIPVCNSLHPAVRAVRGMVRPGDPRDIAEIVVSGPASLGGFMRPDADNALARRFNLRFALAEELLHHLAPGRPIRLDDLDVAALASRVTLRETLDRHGVCLRFPDRSIEAPLAEPPLATPADALESRLAEKFIAIATPALGAARAEAAWRALMRLDAMPRLDLAAILAAD